MAGEERRTGTPVVVIVAIVGLISTIGASVLSGYWANRNVTETLKYERVAQNQERLAQNRDQRREVYGNYTNSLTKLCEVLANEYYSGPSRSEKEALRKVNEAIVGVVSQNGQTQFIAKTPKLKQVANDITKMAVNKPEELCAPNESFLQSTNKFIETAIADLAVS